MNTPREDQSAGQETVHAERREVLRRRFELKLGYQQIGRSCAIAGRVTLHVLVLVVRGTTLTNDFDGSPLGLAAHTEPMSGCGTRAMV